MNQVPSAGSVVPGDIFSGNVVMAGNRQAWRRRQKENGQSDQELKWPHEQSMAVQGGAAHSYLLLLKLAIYVRK